MKRAMKKFTQLDTDSSGKLEKKELLELGAWVWNSFHPRKECDEATKQTEADKILKRCDKNSDGEIDKDEFCVYYNQTATAIFNFHKNRAAKEKKAKAAAKKE